MYLSVIFLPLISALFSGFLGKFLGSRGSAFLSTLSIFCSFLCSCFIFYEVGLNEAPCIIVFLKWFSTDFLSANWAFLFDSLTVVMITIVTFISCLVHLYSTEYMAHDPHLSRFMSYLSLFTFFMLLLVTSDNFIQLFVGWEGVGLCSYLLINFWFTRIQANKAAIKAMLVNRIGDFGLALGIFIIYCTFNSVEFLTVFSLAPYFISDTFYFLGYQWDLLTIITLLLFVGAVGKSAQIGLHTWLPDAMEGPTPVSALIHAATMVTAGVFLIARCSPLFEHAPFTLFIVTLFGGITSFFAASTGLLQNDLKKVIAYSTCSQLGYMIFACGLSHYSVGIFHLSNHAFFKALLFLGAGSVIHGVADEQDMRRMGGLKRLLPFTFSIMLIGSLALIGFPFLTGFYSKDLILEVAYSKYSLIGHFAYWVGTFSAFLTAFYSTRLLYLTFLVKPNGFKSVVLGAHDSNFKMAFPLFLLSLPTIFIGYLSRDFFVGFGSSFWNNSILILAANYTFVDSEFIPHIFKILPIIISMFGLLFAFVLYIDGLPFLYGLKISYIGRHVYTFLNRKWFFDKIYNEYINQTFLKFGYVVTYKMLDKGLFEMLGPYSLPKIFKKGSLFIVSNHTGNIYEYLLWMFLVLSFIFLAFNINFILYLVDFQLILLYFVILGFLE